METIQQADNPQTEEIASETSDRYTQRQMRIESRRAGRSARSGDSWIGAAFLIVLGFFFLLNNLSVFHLENWWALFILIPAVAAFGKSWRSYRNSGHLSAPARASLLSGCILTILSAIFLFNLDWLILGPVLLIVAGVGLFINAMLPD